MIRKIATVIVLAFATTFAATSVASASSGPYPATEEAAERYVAKIERTAGWLARSDRQIASEAAKICRAVRKGSATLGYVQEVTSWDGRSLSRSQARAVRAAVREWCV